MHGLGATCKLKKYLIILLPLVLIFEIALISFLWLMVPQKLWLLWPCQKLGIHYSGSQKNWLLWALRFRIGLLQVIGFDFGFLSMLLFVCVCVQAELCMMLIFPRLASGLAMQLMKQGAMMTVLSTLVTALAWPAVLLAATDFIDSKWTIAINRFTLLPCFLIRSRLDRKYACLWEKLLCAIIIWFIYAIQDVRRLEYYKLGLSLCLQYYLLG